MFGFGYPADRQMKRDSDTGPRGATTCKNESKKIDLCLALVVAFRTRESHFVGRSTNPPVQQARFWGTIPYPGSLSLAFQNKTPGD